MSDFEIWKDWGVHPVSIKNNGNSCEVTITSTMNDILSMDRRCEEIQFNFSKNRKIEKVIFNPPATIVFWSNGDKTVVKCDKEDKFDKEKGLAMAISKYFFGNKSNFNNEFKKFIGEDK